MDDTEDDDFGGFEVADADSEPALVENDLVVGEDAAVTSGMSAIPWLAASIQASSNESSLFGAETTATTGSGLNHDVAGVFDLNKPTKLSDTKSADAAIVEQSSVVTSLVGDLKSQLETALEEKQTYRSETVELKQKQEANHQALARLETELTNQKKVYEELQAKHSVELEQLRKANSTALSVVTEEYKESMKLSITEQQKACTQLFTEQMEREWCKVQQVLQDQTEKFESWKLEFNRSLDETHERELAKLRQEVEEEKEELKKSFQRELEKTNEVLAVVKSECIQDIQSELDKKMSELELKSKEILGQATEELKDNMKSQSKLISDQERTMSMDYWERQSSNMTERIQESIEGALQVQKESLNEYISQHIQMDQLAQKKHLSAVNVYLEAASKHITAITDPDAVS